ncbi:hypothetical protein LL946_17590 [Knoellia locipacati]|uniref:hypothetical protein n=1 Tax=Knoellia locipacati TaxID=882824 RepID=UPI00384EC962
MGTLARPPQTRAPVRRADEHVGSWRRRVLSGLLLATGSTALVCGGVMALDPDGTPLGLTAEFLQGSPFDDWWLPGLALGGFVGVGHLVAGTSVLQRRRHSRELSLLAGAGLVAFEAVEWAWMGFHPLQPVFMVVGATVVGLAARR